MTHQEYSMYLDIRCKLARASVRKFSESGWLWHLRNTTHLCQLCCSVGCRLRGVACLWVCRPLPLALADGWDVAGSIVVQHSLQASHAPVCAAKATSNNRLQSGRGDQVRRSQLCVETHLSWALWCFLQQQAVRLRLLEMRRGK